MLSFFFPDSSFLTTFFWDGISITGRQKMMLEENDRNLCDGLKKPFHPESNNLSISCFLIGTGKIFHDITSRDNSDKGFIVISTGTKFCCIALSSRSSIFAPAFTGLLS